MSMGDDSRKRIKDRIADMGLSVAEVERRAGFRPSYVHELLSGKKKTVRGDAMERLAKVLKTSDLWLLRGIGAPEQAVSTAFSMSNSNIKTYCEAMSEAKSIESSENIEATIIGMTNETCEITFRIVIGGAIQRGFVSDPAFYTPRNIYFNSFAERRTIRLHIKVVKMGDGENQIVVIDAAPLG